MLSQYKPQNQRFDSAMGAYLFAQSLETADEVIGCGGEWLARYGRRILHGHDGGGPIEYTRCESVSDACHEFEEKSFPDENDSTICEDGRGRYRVAFAGVHCATLATRVDAELRLALEMVRNGEFTRAWFYNDRGMYFPIDNEIRAYHNEGGDDMKPEFLIGGEK